MKKMFYYAIIIATAAVTGCGSDNTVGTPDNNEEQKRTMDVDTGYAAVPIQLNNQQQEINVAMRTFSWQLFSQVYANRDSDNVLTSPISLEYLLGMLQNGLQGDSKEQLLTAMGVKEVSSTDLNDYFSTMISGIADAGNNTSYTSANSVWYRSSYALRSTFTQPLSDKYSCEAYPVTTFGSEATDKINAWVSQKTNGKIPALLSSTSSDDLLYLINCVYFRSAWQEPFIKSNTQKATFTQTDGQKVETDMMRGNISGICSKGEDYRMAVLPFSHRSFSMFFILPNYGVTIEQVMKEIEASPASVSNASNLSVTLPKFTAYGDVNLKGILKDMGMTGLFSASDDFILFEGQNEAVSKMIQKANLRLDENGAEASAATYANIKYTADAESGTETFIFNRPFLYGIMEKSTGCPLFIGYQGSMK